MESQQEPEAPLEIGKTEPSPMDKRQPPRQQRMQHVPNRYQLHVTLVYAAPAEPDVWYQAIDCLDAQKCSHAMNVEYNSLLENHTWEVVKRAVDENVIPCK